MRLFCPTITRLHLAAVAVIVLAATPVLAQRQMEKLGRGVIAVRTGTSSAYIGWQLLATGSGTIGFYLLRSASSVTKQGNSQLITHTTGFTDIKTQL